MTIVHRTRADLATRPIAAAITTRGKELSIDDTVADARRLLATRAVRVVPVLDGAAYVGAVDRDTVGGADPSAAVGPLAAALVPTALAATPATEALAALDRHDGKRLVILAGDDATYVGLVCLRGDRERLCVDAELAHDPTALPIERTPL